MKLVMTLLARDEADIVDAQIAFHLNAGVDFVVATDNRSVDGTAEIFERYERAGYLHLIREHADDMRQGEWVTRMARLAATDLSADWVINSDADEFWWPRAGSLKDVLATVPRRFGVVRGCWRHFVPRPDDGSCFAERMTVRLTRPAFAGDKRTVFHTHQKVAHRASPDVVVEAGNHYARGPGLDPLRAWHPIEVLHFSVRSIAQLERKGAGGWARNRDYVLAEHQLRLDDATRSRRLGVYFDSLAPTSDQLALGLADGTFVIDTRLRDVLRVLRQRNRVRGLPGFALPDWDGSDRLSFPRPSIQEDAAYASEASALVDLDGVVRAEERVEAIEARIAGLEHSWASRLIARGSRRPLPYTEPPR
jgi:Glycosyl transferase family 2